MRPVEGKTDCILLDNAGNFARFGDPLDLEDYSLTDDVKVPRPLQTKQCKACFAVIPATARACPFCSFVPEVEARDVRESDDELVEVSPLHRRYLAMGPEERFGIYRQLMIDAQGYGYKPGWAAYQYRARFGIWPEPEIVARAEAGTKKPIEALASWISTTRERGYKPGWASWRFKTVYGRWPNRIEKSEAERVA